VRAGWTKTSGKNCRSTLPPQIKRPFGVNNGVKRKGVTMERFEGKKRQKNIIGLSRVKSAELKKITFLKYFDCL